MNEEMNICELLKEVVEENQTRKILEILNQSKDLEEFESLIAERKDQLKEEKRLWYLHIHFVCDKLFALFAIKSPSYSYY